MRTPAALSFRVIGASLVSIVLIALAARTSLVVHAAFECRQLAPVEELADGDSQGFMRVSW